MASSCIRGGLDYILGKISLLKEWSSIGTRCAGKWWRYHPGGVQKTCRSGNSGIGSVGTVGMD